MEQYPHTEYYHKATLGETIWAFEKIDGSNFRVEFAQKLSQKSNFTHGFKKFGTRTQLIDNRNQYFGDGVDYFEQHLAEPLEKIFREEAFFRKHDKITVFCEYWGPGSFAGQHVDSEPKKLTIIDLHLYKNGIIHPKYFVKYLEGLDTAKLLYHGELTPEFIQEVQNGKYGEGEGVMAKGYRTVKSRDIVHMYKIKTNRWFEKLKEKYGQAAVEKELKNQ